MTPKTMTPRTMTLRIVVALGWAVGFAACDTGDGTRLMEPTSQTTLPPPDTAPLPSEPLGDAAGVPDVDDLQFGDPTADSSRVDAGEAGTGEPFELFTPWAEGAGIDPLYTCDGNNASPPITWAGVPAGTSEVAVSLVDESELNNGRPFIHWVVAGLDPTLGGLDESELPDGAIQGLNFFGDVTYTGPCPDPGETHTYRLTVYALGQQVELADGTPAAELLDFVETVSLAEVTSSVTATR